MSAADREMMVWKMSGVEDSGIRVWVMRNVGVRSVGEIWG